MTNNPRAPGDNLFSGDMDPEIADLIKADGRTDGLACGAESGDDVPDFADLMGEDSSHDNGTPGAATDMSVTTFARPRVTEEDPKPLFSDRNFYRNALTGEGEAARRVHTILGQFLNSQDPQDRSMHRGRLIPAYWELYRNIALKISNRLPRPKLLLLRYGVLLPTMISAEQRTMLSRIIMTNNTGEPVYYADEWLLNVARGRINASATDETKPSQRREPDKVNALLEKTRGKHQAQLNLIRNTVGQMDSLEDELKMKAQIMGEHDLRPESGGLPAPYNDVQRSAIGEISNLVRRLSSVNRELTRHYRELEDLDVQLQDLSDREDAIGEVQVDSRTIAEEANTVRQMVKLCVGRQGNHFPIVMKQYLRGAIFEIGTRENVLNMLADTEYLDPGVFLRTFKMQTNRIVPNVVLLPCYGEQGICWEPFERYNRASSRGRLAIPMYPKDLRTAVIAALGDLRWQIAKEKAQHYWMEEGLTGWYYQWFNERKMRGDVKDAFIQDYILWIARESEGTQKLDREVRDIFWRYVPFPQDIKDKLKNRGFVYTELYRKDQNRALSDGY